MAYIKEHVSKMDNIFSDYIATGVGPGQATRSLCLSFWASITSVICVFERRGILHPGRLYRALARADSGTFAGNHL